MSASTQAPRDGKVERRTVPAYIHEITVRHWAEAKAEIGDLKRSVSPLLEALDEAQILLDCDGHHEASRNIEAVLAAWRKKGEG